MVEYHVSHTFRQRLLEQERQKEDIRRKRLANQQTTQWYPSSLYRSPYSPPAREGISRRTLVKGLIWMSGFAGFVALAGGVFLYLNSLPQLRYNPPVQPSSEQTASEQTSSENWPLRRSLTELKDAQREMGSLSKYIIYEFDSLPNDDMLRAHQNDWVSLTREEFIKLYGEDDADWVTSGNPRLTIYGVGDSGNMYTRLLFDSKTNQGTVTYGYTGNRHAGNPISLQELISVWDSEDKTDKVFVKSKSGSYQETVTA